MLARLEAHVAEQQRFAANASHELRTPLAITQTLLDVARNDPTRDTGELVERLHVVNARAIDLTEALLLLSRADQRPSPASTSTCPSSPRRRPRRCSRSPRSAASRFETSGDVAPAVGSPALLLQMTTNLVHNAIVHNLPEDGTVRVSTALAPERGGAHRREHRRGLTPPLVATLTEPFQRGTARIRSDHAGVGLGLAIVNEHRPGPRRNPSVVPRPGGGIRVTAQLPPVVADGRG